jgi:hypothetical protein
MSFINQNVEAVAGKGIVFESASRGAAAYTSQEFHNASARGIRIFTANDAAGGSTATVKVQVKAPGSAVWIDLAGAATAALGSTTGSIITIYPGLTGIADAAGVTINQHIGQAWRLVLTVGVATGTSSVSAVYLL